MNAFPLITDVLLNAYRSAALTIENGETEPGAAPLKQRHLSELNAKIRQLEQQSGQVSASLSESQFPPLVRLTPQFAINTTEIAGVVIPLGENPNVVLDYSTMPEDAVDTLTLEQMAKLVVDSHLLDSPDDETELRAMLKRAVAGGAFKPEAVSQRKEVKRMIEALGEATPDEILDTYNEHTIRQAAGYVGLLYTDREPKKIGVKHVLAVKDALQKKRDIEAAVNDAGGEV